MRSIENIGMTPCVELMTNTVASSSSGITKRAIGLGLGAVLFGSVLVTGSFGLRPAEASMPDGHHSISIATRIAGNTVAISQHLVEDRPGGGCITSQTRLEVCVQAPGGGDPACQPIVVRADAHDMPSAHAAGLLFAIGAAGGLDPNAILIGLRQAGLAIDSVSVVSAPQGGVSYPPGPPTLATALVDLINASLSADRPGGGCDQVQPLFDAGAAALGFQASCPNAVPPQNLPLQSHP
jgi:hypothetical protein